MRERAPTLLDAANEYGDAVRIRKQREQRLAEMVKRRDDLAKLIDEQAALLLDCDNTIERCRAALRVAAAEPAPSEPAPADEPVSRETAFSAETASRVDAMVDAADRDLGV